MWPFRRRIDDDFGSEIESHIAIETDRLIAEGLPPGEAALAARRRFGNVTSARERFYESRRLPWLDELRQDVRYTVRTLRRFPGFATVAILTLTIGIGANTAIFSVVNAALLRPLPYRDPGSLVLIESSPLATAPPSTVLAWRERARSLSDFGGFVAPRAGTLIAGTQPEQVYTADVTWNFFSFLGIPPAVGRDFTEADASAGAAAVAILSHDLWISRFGGDDGIIGRALALSGESVTIVGITAPAFRFPAGGAPLGNGLPSDTQPDVIRVASPSRSLNVIGRLSPGMTPASAGAELLAIFKQDGNLRYSRTLLDRLELRATSLQQRLVGDLRQRLLLVMAAVAFVLLVACANVANLLLARASTRQRELAVRTALGAWKGRLARLVLTESVLLALAGSAGALLLTWWTSGVARTLLADRLPHVQGFGIDWWVLGFNVAIAVSTGILCGLASVPGVTRVNLAAIFSDSGAPVTGRTTMRRALLSTEVAVTFVLVVGAALLVQTLWNLNHQPRGFDADRLLTIRVAPAGPPLADARDVRARQTFLAAFFTDLTQRMGKLPGVVSAAAVSSVPLAGVGVGMENVAVDGLPRPTEDTGLVPVASVTPGYFRSMDIALTAGRDFDDGDRLGAQRVTIVNEAFRRRFAPGRDIIGSRVTSGNNILTVVGLVEDVPELSLREPPRPLLFTPLEQMAATSFFWSQLRIVLRTKDADPRTLVPVVRSEIWAVDRDIVIDEVASMEERVAATVRSERDSAVLFGLFAVAALAIAAIGVYGVAAYALAQRTKEIGIRVALGAARHDVTSLVMSQTLWPTLAGIGLGLAAAAAATRLLASMLYGVTPLDPATFAGAGFVLVAVALAATYVPARRATTIDPLVALRYE